VLTLTELAEAIETGGELAPRWQTS
jgi:hypothetical protein